MKLLQYIVSVFCLIMVMNCYNSADKKCNVNKKYSYYFSESINTINTNYLDTIGSTTKFSDYGSREFLEMVTGIKSNVSKNNFGVYYKKRDDFDKDILSWEEWYLNNKCLVSTQRVDSIFLSYKNAKVNSREKLPEKMRLELGSIPESLEELLNRE